MSTEKHIETLRSHFKTHKATSDFLGVSYGRYHKWVRNPEIIPRQGKRLIELAVESIRDNPHQLKS